MASKYFAPSVGVGAADELRAYLVQQEAKRRQSILDELAVDQNRRANDAEKRLEAQSAASTDTSKANTASLIEQRDAAQRIHDEELKAKRTQRAVQTHRIGDQLDPNDDAPDELVRVDERSLASTHRAGSLPAMAGINNPSPAPPAVLSDEDSHAAVNKRTYTGDAKQRGQAELLNTIEDPKLREQYRLLLESGATLGGEDINALTHPKPVVKETKEVGGFLFERQDDGSWKKVAEGRAPQPQRDPVPVVIQTPFGPQLVNRGNGTASPVVGPDGRPISPQSKVQSVLESVAELSEKINTGQGVLAKITGAAEKAAAKANLDDDVAEYEALVSAFTPLWARALGHTGVLTEQDVASARKALPQPGDSKSLRDRKMARIAKIMGGDASNPMGGGNGPTPNPGGPAPSSETPEQRRKRLYDQFSKP